jgi:hypothetical protein
MTELIRIGIWTKKTQKVDQGPHKLRDQRRLTLGQDSSVSVRMSLRSAVSKGNA